MLIKAAGGFLNSAFLKSVEIRRQTRSNIDYIIDLNELDLTEKAKINTSVYNP